MSELATYVIAWVLATAPAPIESSLEEYLCMVEAIHFEARGEGHLGKVAVANVIQQRIEDQRYFPNTVCENITKHAAFEYKLKGLNTIVLDNQIELDSFIESAQVAVEAVNWTLPNIVKGADHFFNPNLANPDWANAAIARIDIYNHRFLNLYNGDFEYLHHH